MRNVGSERNVRVKRVSEVKGCEKSIERVCERVRESEATREE